MAISRSQMGSQMEGNRMPLTTKGKKIKKAMEDKYGKERGERVFYASENKGSIKGVAKKAAGGTARGDGVCERGKTRGTVVGMKKGGKTESRVNEAGNYTKPGMRKSLFNKIKAGGKGGKPGQWSARKAQMLAKRYKEEGGGYTS